MEQSFSYWEQKTFLSGFDVLIIGSGIVGLNTALHLTANQPSLKIAVLESGLLPTGASTKNAGFACFGSISEAINEITLSGEDNFLELVELRWKGLALLRKTLGDQAISYRQLGGFDLFKTEETDLAEQCIQQVNYMNGLLKPIIGKHDIYAVANAKIAGFGFKGIKYLIENKYEGQVDTGRMMSALISKVAGLGVMIYNQCHVYDIDTNIDGYTLSTGAGNFHARSVILATNAFAKELAPELEVIPGRGQVLVTEPVPNLKVKGTFHYNRGYTYFRNIDNRILLGGFRDLDVEAEQTTRPGLTELVQLSLETLLTNIIVPGQRLKIDYRWSGVMGFGPELKPIVKEIRPRMYCAVRCSGMGVAMGSLLGQQVAQLVKL